MSETAPERPNEERAVSASRRLYVLSTVMLASLYVAARLWRLTNSCLWFDELFGVHAARHNWGDMLGFVAADIIHPPLFYVLLKLWIGAGGESLLWLRLFPVLTSIAALVPFLLLARELRLRSSETNLALLLLAVNGYLIKYAQEVRMYSLLLFFTLCSLWLFVKFIKREGSSRVPLTALFLINFFLVFTHYYGWVVVSTEVLFLLLKRRDKLSSFLLPVVALVLCFVPWVYAVASSSETGRELEQNLGWVTRPRPADLTQFITLLHEPFYFRQSSAEPPYTRLTTPLGLLLFGVPVVLLLWRGLRRGRDENDERISDERMNDERVNKASWLVAFFAFPVALTFVAAYILPQSIWGTRHLIIVAAPYLILASVALNRVRTFWLKTTLLTILGCWLALAAAGSLLRREGGYIWCAWENLAARAINESHDATSAPVNVYAFEDLVAYHLWFASGAIEEPRFKVVVVKHVPGLVEDPAYFLPRKFDAVPTTEIGAVKDERFWIAFSDVSLDEKRPPLNILMQRNYRVERTFESGAQGRRAFLVLLQRAP